MAELFTLRNGLTTPIILLFFLLPTILWLLGLCYWHQFLRHRWQPRLQPLAQSLVNVLLALGTLLLVCRALLGIAVLLHLSNDIGDVGPFYPLRGVTPNYQLLLSLPWFVVFLAMMWHWPHLENFLASTRWRFVWLWLLAALVLLVFAGIQGGLVLGVSGVFDSEEHLADLAKVRWDTRFLQEHLLRLQGAVQPAYIASHFTTHPPFALQVFSLVQVVGPFGMGLICLACFALAVPLIDLLIRVRHGEALAFHRTLLVFTTPAYLVYGAGNDDSLYYLLWASVLVAGHWAFVKQQWQWAMVAGAVIVVASNVTYASLVLIPSSVAFHAQVPVRGLLRWMQTRVVPISILLLTVALGLGLEACITGFNVLAGMREVFRYQEIYTFFNWMKVDPARAISDRQMLWAEFVFFGGPLVIMTWWQSFSQRARDVLQWSIPALAFVVLAIWLALNSPGAGESGRGWGGLYMYWWAGAGLWITLPWSRKQLEPMIRFMLVFAAVLQLSLNLNW